MSICIQQPVSHSIDNNIVKNSGDRSGIFYTKQDNNYHTLVVIDPSVDNWDVLVGGVKQNSKILLP